MGKGEKNLWEGLRWLWSYISPRTFPSSLPVPGLWELPSFILNNTYFIMLFMFPRKLYSSTPFRGFYFFFFPWDGPILNCSNCVHAIISHMLNFELSEGEFCSLSILASSVQHRNRARGRYTLLIIVIIILLNFRVNILISDSRYAINEESALLWVLST